MIRFKPSAGFTCMVFCTLALSCGDSSKVFFSQLPEEEPGVSRGSNAGRAGGAGEPNTAQPSPIAGSASGGNAGNGSSSGESGSSSGGVINGAAGHTGVGGTGGSSAASGFSAGGSAANCGSHDECPTGTFCQKPSCQAPTGTCVTIEDESSCDSHEEPVCGCNGYTYISACLAAQYGENVAYSGMCKEGAKRCASKAACSEHENSDCLMLAAHRSECGRPSARIGTCWVLPDVCANTGPMRVRSCGGGEQCHPLCEAARRDDYYHLGGECGE